jgi:hypothetical protein
LGDREDLGFSRGGSSCCDLVPCSWVAVDCVDSSFSSNECGEGDRHVAGAGSYVDASPSGAEAETLKRSGKRSAVDVVSKFEFGHDFRVVVAWAEQHRWS